MKNPNTNKNEVFLFDSLNSGKEISSILINTLLTGASRPVQIDSKLIWQAFPGLLDKDPICWNISNKMLQTASDNTCAYWSIYNLIMLVFFGSNKYWKILPDSAPEQYRLLAGSFLRNTFDTLIPASDALLNPKDYIYQNPH